MNGDSASFSFCSCGSCQSLVQSSPCTYCERRITLNGHPIVHLSRVEQATLAAVQALVAMGTRRCAPNHQLQPTRYSGLRPLPRSAELGRWAP